MTKCERIMFLINLIRTEGAASVTELSQKCEVSPRTIYRDLSFMEKMGMPIICDREGYHLSDETGFYFSDLSPEDSELLLFCLRNNPLVDQPYFGARLRRLEQKVEQKQQNAANNDNRHLFLSEMQRKLISEDGGPSSDILDRFVRAMTGHCIVKLESGDRTYDGVYIPLAVRIHADGARLVVTPSMHHAPIEIEVGKIAQLRLTDSRFDRRPVELLEP